MPTGLPSWRHLDLNLRSCGLHGHATYAPDEPELAARLRAETALGEAWRCLRCGAFVTGSPQGRGPADEAPLVLRGAALKDALVLRLLAVEKGIRGALIVLLAFGIWRFDGSRSALQQVFDSYLPLLTPVFQRLGIDLANTGPVHLIESAFAANHRTLTLVAAAVLGYGALQLVESTGLWLMRRWGEYVAAVGTTVFIPLEIYELHEKVTSVRILALVVNLFAIGYLVWTKRLFGLRGGHAAYVAQRHTASLIEVERAAGPGPVPTAIPRRHTAPAIPPGRSPTT